MMQKSRPTSQRHRAAFVVLFFGSIGGKKVLKKFYFLGEKAKTGVFLRMQKPRGLINQGRDLGNTAFSFSRKAVKKAKYPLISRYLAFLYARKVLKKFYSDRNRARLAC